MKIRVTNFRCYTEKEFDLGDDGLVLISGMSGAGKSSILMALSFALFNEPKKDMKTQGAKSCKVSVDYQEHTFTRTTNPSSFTVVDSNGETYIEDEAESLVREMFGEQFRVISYVPQGIHTSFLSMTPAEKLAFLEKIAFSNVKPSDLREKCQSRITTANNQLISVRSKLEIQQERLGKLKLLEEAPFPFPQKSDKNREKHRSNHITKMKNASLLETSYRKSLNMIRAQQTAQNLNCAKRSEKEKNLTVYRAKYDKVQAELGKIKYCGDDNLKMYKRQLEILISNREYLCVKDLLEKERKKYQELSIAEEQEISQKIRQITERLWAEMSLSEVEDTERLYTRYRACIEKMQKIPSVCTDEELAQIQESIHALVIAVEQGILLKQEGTYTCPKCHTGLRLKNKNLIVNDLGDITDSHESLCANLEKNRKLLKEQQARLVKEEHNREIWDNLQSEKEALIREYTLPEESELADSIRSLAHYKTQQLQLEQDLKRLQENKLPKHLEIIKTTINKLEKSLGKLAYTETNEDFTEQELRDLIGTEEKNGYRYKRASTEKEELDGEIQKIEQELEQIPVVDTDYEQEITELEEKLTEISHEKERVQGILDQICAYEENHRKRQEYLELQTVVHGYIQQEEKTRELYASCTRLKECITEAEGIALSSLVDTVNEHVSLYLSVFFPDEPMSACLTPFKKSKTKETVRSSLNVEIEYKGMEASLNMLSGGEQSRLNLAFTLAFSEMFNTPLLLLDECTASLDEETTGVVVDTIRENFPGKLVVIIAHQVITGSFDKHIQV